MEGPWVALSLVSVPAESFGVDTEFWQANGENVWFVELAPVIFRTASSTNRTNEWAVRDDYARYTGVLSVCLFISHLRRESETENLSESISTTERTVEDIRASLETPDLELIGPGALRSRSTQFGQGARGEMIWFNVCLLMFIPQDLFDALLRPPIENPRVTSIQFVLDERERERWETEVKPKVEECTGAGSVQEPVWRDLNENVSFILRGTENEQTDALLSFWGEPFMARTTRDVPRYIIHVTRESELIPQLQDIEREHRLQRN